MIDIMMLLDKCAPHVAKSTMSAIIRTESTGNHLAIGINKGYKLKYQPQNLAQAQQWVNYLEKNNYNFDVGIAQINIKNIHNYGYQAADALDPCLNLKIASDILTKNYNQALKSSSSSVAALPKAISAYNTGNFSAGFKNGYVQRVYANAKKPLPKVEDTPPIIKIANIKKGDKIKVFKSTNNSKTQHTTIVYVRKNNAANAFY